MGGGEGWKKDERGGEPGSKRDGKRSRGSGEKGAAPARNFGPAAIAAGGRGRADAGKEKSSVTSRKSSARRGGNARRVAREKKNWGGEGVSGSRWLRGQRKREANAHERSKRAPFRYAHHSPPEVHLFLPLFSPPIISLFPPLLATLLLSPPFLASDRLHAREHLSYIQPRRFFASSFFDWINPSLSLSLSLAFHRVTVTEPTLSLSFSASLLSSFRLLRPSRVRSTLVDEEEKEERER